MKGNSKLSHELEFVEMTFVLVFHSPMVLRETSFELVKGSILSNLVEMVLPANFSKCLSYPTYGQLFFFFFYINVAVTIIIIIIILINLFIYLCLCWSSFLCEGFL